MTVVAAYDIRVDASRARLAALLQAYGNRVQKSVFLLSVDTEELAAIQQRADTILNHDTDSFWLLHQCVTCYEALSYMGQSEPPQPALYWAAF